MGIGLRDVTVGHKLLKNMNRIIFIGHPCIYGGFCERKVCRVNDCPVSPIDRSVVYAKKKSRIYYTSIM